MNEQYRITFQFEEGYADAVTCEDYHMPRGATTTVGLTLTGEPVPIAEQVGLLLDDAMPCVADNGSLLYRAGCSISDLTAT